MHTKPLLLAALGMGWLTLGASLVAAPPVSSAPITGDPPELMELRKHETTKALTAARSLSDQYVKALATLEKDAGIAGEYEQALAAQKRRLELTALYTQLAESTLSNAIVLKPADARLGTGVTHDKAQDALVGWKSVGNVASWDVSRVIPGDYVVTVRYGLAGGPPDGFRGGGGGSMFGPPPGGEFEFYEDSSLPGASANRRTGVVTPTGEWSNIVPLDLPSVQLGRTTARFAIRITKVTGSGGVMLLKDIRLTPVVNKQPSTPEGQTSAMQQYAAIRSAHVDALQQAVLPVLTAYSTQLASLSDQADARKEKELREQVRAEQRRLKKALDNPGPAQLAQFISSDKKLFTLGNEEWRGVRYVPNAANTGSCFMVSYQNEEFPVKLIGVSCPVDAGDTAKAGTGNGHEELETFASYFGITPEDAAALTTQAKDFTASFLAGKDLRLLSRGVVDEDGAVPVTILLEGVGDYAAILVDNGLVSIDMPKSKFKAAHRAEEALLSVLKERETTARARAIPLGGWAMRPEDPSTPSAVPAPALAPAVKQ